MFFSRIMGNLPSTTFELQEVLKDALFKYLYNQLCYRVL